MKIWLLIVYPQRFFRQLFDHPLNLWVSLGIALCANWLRWIALGVWTRNLLPIIPTDIWPSISTSPGETQYWIGSILIGLVGWPFLSWGIYGGIIQLLTGRQWRAWQLVGWTLWPLILVGLMMVGAAWLWPATGSVIPFAQFVMYRPEESLLNQYLTWLNLYRQALSGQIFLHLLFWAVLAGSLWSLWLLYWGVKSLAPQKAVLTTSILTLWVLIWRVL
ncbi:hypothetical protein [Acaryochloris sp. IP29b_bin.137]|uniref:hypothetical protein n=1 Tax=Acaryochloris sp. IP29b_bin.137 TaxID=2969217 RepID=UPI002633731A|nr:hypothetical protein [Acaryochloris sp. IP29b_bin.137]